MRATSDDEDAWSPWVGAFARPVEVRARPLPSSGPSAAWLDAIDEHVERRRRGADVSGVGTFVLLGYEALDPRPEFPGPPVPDVFAWDVDCAVVFAPEGEARVVARPEVDAEVVARAHEAVREAEADPEPVDSGRPVRAVRAGTTLPREAYVRGVERVRDHIRAGDVYQGNLTQMFRSTWRGDPFEAFVRAHRTFPAPRAAYVEAPGFAVASASPETMIDVEDSGLVRTRPIKGTRPRGDDPRSDARYARELERSEKDLAELAMIVDLERNDLTRVCRWGSVHVPELATLRPFPTVHHLVARVEGTLRDDVRCGDVVRAVFPGGSITGAPKRRAIEILRELEPERRGPFTGSLFWFDDDGTVRSSILIRTATFAEGEAWLGAGGGVVADSDAESEWRESNEKARAWARVLGFVPEEAR